MYSSDSVVRQPGVDIWGKSYTVNSLPSYECVHCQKSIASTRYAPHLEKCLGLAGRQSSRVASRRMNTASPFSSDDNTTASPESVDERMNKKKNNKQVKIRDETILKKKNTLILSL